MAQKVKKSTKKFHQKGLDGELKRRKAKKAVRNIVEQKEERLKAAQERQEANDLKKKARSEAAAAMDVDSFLDGGFERLAGSDSEDLPSTAGSDSDTDSGASTDSEDMDDEEVLKMLEEAREEAERGAADEDGPSSSASDDEEDGADPAIAAKTRVLRDSIRSHKEQLEQLREQDPAFYQYLAETDKNLLAFGEGDKDAGEDEEEEDGAAKEGESDEEEADGAGRARRLVATTELVDGWCAAAKERASQATTAVLLKAYRAACHYGAEDDGDGAVSQEMLITSPAVFNRLMLFVLKEIHGIFLRMLSLEGRKSVTHEDIAKSPRWKKVEPLVRTYLGNTLQVLRTVTDRGLLAFVLRRLRASVPLMLGMNKVQSKLLKQAVELFRDGERKARIQAFLLVREMGMSLPDPALEDALKALVKAYAGQAKLMTAASAPHLNFMASCISEMLSVDPAASYALGFTYVKQLAMRMRAALTQRTKEAFRECYNWQYINCLELWARALAAHHDRSELRPLVYPVTQLLLGCARLVPTPRYFPLRLRCVAMLNQLCRATDSFAPIAPVLLEMLDFSGFKKRAKAPGAPHDMGLILRVSKSALRTASFQDVSMEGLLLALADHLAQWSCHVAFPELAFPVLVRLRRFAKSTNAEKLRRHVRAFSAAVERNMEWVGLKRDGVDFSPRDADKIAAFLAQENARGASPVQQLARQLEQRARERRSAMHTEEVLVGEGGGAEESEDEDEDDGEDGEEEEWLGEKPEEGRGGDDSDGEDGGEDDGDEELPRTPGPRVSREGRRGGRARVANGGGGWDDGLGSDEDDQVEDFVMSGSEDEDVEDGGSRKGRAKGKGSKGVDGRGGRGGEGVKRGGAGKGGKGKPGLGARDAGVRKHGGGGKGPDGRKWKPAFDGAATEGQLWKRGRGCKEGSGKKAKGSGGRK